MARTRLVSAGQIECSKSDGSVCILQRQKEETYTGGTTDGSLPPWSYNGNEVLTLGGKHVNELPDGRFQVVSTGEILTRVGKAK